MIRDNPQGADLLSEARRVLTNAVLPTLSPDVRYQTLMVIKAISLVENQLRANVETEVELEKHLAQIVGENDPDPVRSFARQIQTGGFDASSEVFQFLTQVVAFKMGEANSGKKLRHDRLGRNDLVAKQSGPINKK